MAEGTPCPTRKKRVWGATVGRMISHSSLIMKVLLGDLRRSAGRFGPGIDNRH